MNAPSLNIESIGYKSTNNGSNIARKCFLASLDFVKKHLFKNVTKTYYLPIKFNSESEIRDIFEYYDNLYFQVIVYNTLRANLKTKEYHISKYKDIAKLLFWKDFILNPNDAHGFTIDFKIKYKNANIIIVSYTHKFNIEYLSKFTSIFGNHNKFLNFFKEQYSIFPDVHKFTVNRENSDDKYCSTIADAISYIDRECEKEQKLNDEIESIYSKKLFKLIEK